MALSMGGGAKHILGGLCLQAMRVQRFPFGESPFQPSICWKGREMEESKRLQWEPARIPQLAAGANYRAGVVSPSSKALVLQQEL